jgi:hypothetical protein
MGDVAASKILPFLGLKLQLKHTVQAKNEESKITPGLDTLLNLGIW